MTISKLSVLLSLVMLPALASAAAPKDHTTEAVAAANSSVAAASQPAELPDAADSLPDLPPVQTTALSFRSGSAEPAMPANRSSRISFGSPHSRGVSPLASMPLAGAARRLGAERFNMDDGSMLDDFAICYRMTSRSSIEVIPGDPAPVKLPVVSMANNTGVTVGLVMRLSK